MVEDGKDAEKGGEFTAIQISKRVHRKVKLACWYADRQIGQTTDEMMETWADSIAASMGFTFPAEESTE